MTPDPGIWVGNENTVLDILSKGAVLVLSFVSRDTIKTRVDFCSHLFEDFR